MIVAAHSPSGRVRLFRRSLRLTAGEKDVRVPLEDIERVILGSRTVISPQSLTALLGRGIPVAFVSAGGRHLGSFEPPSPPRGLTRRSQYLACAGEAFRLAIASALVSAKIHNARRSLQRLNARRPSFDKNILSQFRQLARQAEGATGVEALRGIEGAAAARYFSLWAGFFPVAFPFEKRSTRPPLNPVNAVLSYTSTLVYGEILSATLARGLDPAPGCLHETTDDRHSLPLDLMEPFRPALVESLTLRMFSLGILNPSHFVPHGRGVYLNPTGRSLLFEQYEDRLTRRFLDPATGQRTNFRTLLRDTPLRYKMALVEPSRFNPFLMP